MLIEHGGLSAGELPSGSETDSAGNSSEKIAATSGNKNSGFTEQYRKFISWPGFQQPMIFGHLWFLYFLCLILVPFALFAIFAERIKWQGLPAWMLRSPGVLLWLVPLTMIPQWFNGLIIPGFGPDTSLTLFPYPHLLGTLCSLLLRRGRLLRPRRRGRAARTFLVDSYACRAAGGVPDRDGGAA